MLRISLGSTEPQSPVFTTRAVFSLRKPQWEHPSPFLRCKSTIQEGVLAACPGQAMSPPPMADVSQRVRPRAACSVQGAGCPPGLTCCSQPCWPARLPASAHRTGTSTTSLAGRDSRQAQHMHYPPRRSPVVTPLLVASEPCAGNRHSPEGIHGDSTHVHGSATGAPRTACLGVSEPRPRAIRHGTAGRDGAGPSLGGSTPRGVRGVVPVPHRPPRPGR